jgi:hypothetical protein
MKNKISWLISIILVFSLLASCARTSKGSSMPAAPYVADKVAEMPRDEALTADISSGEAARPQKQESMDRKIVRTAAVTLYVENLDRSLEAIEAAARQYGGMVANKSLQSSDSQAYGTLVLWIPAQELMRFVDGMKAVGKVRTSSVTAEDISDQYYDLDARLRNAKKQEERLLSLLDRKDNRLEHVLKLENELGRIRGEIETMEGRKRRFDQLVSFSTVTVSIYQDIQAAREPDDVWKPIRQAMRDAKPTFISSVGAIVSLAAGIFTTVIALIPWMPLVLLGFWLIGKIRGRMSGR